VQGPAVLPEDHSPLLARLEQYKEETDGLRELLRVAEVKADGAIKNQSHMAKNCSELERKLAEAEKGQNIEREANVQLRRRLEEVSSLITAKLT
jgi:uncharacterized membrane protein YccC